MLAALWVTSPKPFSFKFQTINFSRAFSLASLSQHFMTMVLQAKLQRLFLGMRQAWPRLCKLEYNFVGQVGETQVPWHCEDFGWSDGVDILDILVSERKSRAEESTLIKYAITISRKEAHEPPDTLRGS